MAKGITLGLKQIVDVAEGIKGGNLKLRTNLTRHDELGELAEDFNIMLDTIDEKNIQLKSNHQKFETLYKERDLILSTIDDVLYQIDLDGNMVLWNKHLKEVTGLTEQEVKGRSALDFFPDYDKEKVAKAIMEALEQGIAQVEADYFTVDGIKPYEFKGTSVIDSSGNLTGLTGIGRDISLRKQMEVDKKSLESQLFHTQKVQAIGQLTGGVAHDFNNILAVILGYTELSQELYGKDNENLNQYLKEIYTAGTRGRELIQQMMIYSRKDQSQENIAPMKIDSIVEETARMLKATFPASINIETDITKNIPYVKCNSSLISQVLMNLCINAKDGMNKEGNLFISLKLEMVNELECSACHKLSSGEYVVIMVRVSLKK